MRYNTAPHTYAQALNHTSSMHGRLPTSSSDTRSETNTYGYPIVKIGPMSTSTMQGHTAMTHVQAPQTEGHPMMTHPTKGHPTMTHIQAHKTERHPMITPIQAPPTQEHPTMTHIHVPRTEGHPMMTHVQAASSHRGTPYGDTIP